MKTTPIVLLCALLFLGPIAHAQIDITFAAGTSSYMGDLKEKAISFSQPSYAFNVGMSYQFTNKFSWRNEIGYSKIQASDSKNKRADLIARNLNFKSDLLSLNSMVQYDFLSMEDHTFSPYVFLGAGLLHFNPYTTDRFGKKQFLQPLTTEGQGLLTDANLKPTKPYARTILEIPFGGGIKFELTDHIRLGIELKYHFVDSDYLDDVSQGGYPSQTMLAAKNPLIPLLTYRGDELPGGAAYPKGGLNRGNPNNRDSYMNIQVKVAFRIKHETIEINY
jgi:opacity protein-like surface antigen